MMAMLQEMLQSKGMTMKVVQQPQTAFNWQLLQPVRLLRTWHRSV